VRLAADRAADPGADRAEASQNPQKIPSGLVLSANSAKSMFARDRFATIGSTSDGIDRNMRPTCLRTPQAAGSRGRGTPPAAVARPCGRNHPCRRRQSQLIARRAKPGHPSSQCERAGGRGLPSAARPARGGPEDRGVNPHSPGR
jgi:hypothetical protein